MFYKKYFSTTLFCLFIFTLNAGNDLTFLVSKIKDYRYTKHLDSAKFYFAKALPIALKKSDSITVFYCYKYLGDAYEQHQHYDSTLLMYDYCEKFIPKNDLKLTPFLLGDKAYTYQLLYDYDKSTELTLQALKLATKLGDKRRIASLSISVAEGFSELNLNKQAEEYYVNAIHYSKQTKDTLMLYESHKYYGAYFLNNKQFDFAYLNFIEAEGFAIALKDSISMAYVWQHLADYYWYKKNTDTSFYFAKKAEIIWERRAEYLDLSAVYLQQAKFYLQLNKYKQAEIFLLKTEKLIKQDLYFNEEFYSCYSELYSKTNRNKLAYNYLIKAKLCGQQIHENERLAKTTSLRLKFEADQKEIIIKQEKDKKLIAQLDAQVKQNQRNIAYIILITVIIALAIVVVAYQKIKNKNQLLNTSNNKLHNLASQKQILLKEVHHRVKNNLTTLKSLLFLQAKASDNAEVKLILEECQLRIQSMALIHQNLYEEGGKETVEFHQFIEQLIEALKLSFNTVVTQVEVEIKSNKVSLDISLALFLGLVLNELVTNSYKYAFKNKTKGKISLNIAHENEKIIVTYYDDGVGLPNGFTETTEGFGFKLMRILTQQINAKLDYSYANHLSTFIIIIDDAK